MLGTAAADAGHIESSMLKPETGRQLHQLFLAKGVLATTAIEGNTLSEDDALRAVQGTLELPESQQYLGQEIRNIIDAANEIKDRMVDLPDASTHLSREAIEHYNGMVLRDLPLDDATVPGRIRNGRTARLLEVQILLAAELPVPVCHLLSNHYNQTRSEYYRQLDAASRSGDAIPFVEYAVRGLVDGLEEALATIRAQQFSDRWEQYVYETFGELKTEADRRRLRLVLDLTRHHEETLEPVEKRELRRLSPALSEAYAGKTVKTLTRDLNAVLAMGLIEAEDRGYVPRDWIILTFRPQRRDAGRK